MNKKKNSEDLVFLPLGGVGEIGMNFALYGYGPARERRWIIVDVGVTFPGDDLPGADLILPNIDFITERADQLDGIIITHAHEDHYGALMALWPLLRVPVYCTAFTSGICAKLSGSICAAHPVTITFEVGFSRRNRRISWRDLRTASAVTAQVFTITASPKLACSAKARIASDS